MNDLSGGSLSKDDILEALGDESNVDSNDSDSGDVKEESDEKPKSTKDEIKDNKEDESGEKLDLEEASEDDSKLDEDDLEFKDLPSRKEIKAKYPEIFKDFPNLEAAIYRDQAYTQVFPTIADAKEAASDVQTLRAFEGDLLSGNISSILKSVKDTDEKAFTKIGVTILDQLAKVDQNAYLTVANKIVKNAVAAVYAYSKSSGDDQLEIASQLFHRYFWNDPKVTPAENVKFEEDPKETELNKEREEFNHSRLSSAVEDVTERVDTVIESTVSKNIDPKGVMTPFIKNKAVEDVLKNWKKELKGDSRFQAYLSKLWKEAKSNNYNETSKAKIREAIKDKARSTLPNIIQRVKVDALKGLGTRDRKASESRDERPISAGRPSLKDSNRDSGKKQSNTETKIPRNVKTLDFLMQD